MGKTSAQVGDEGIEPSASRTRSERSTDELVPEMALL
jgi:hypothetical protein